MMIKKNLVKLVIPILLIFLAAGFSAPTAQAASMFEQMNDGFQNMMKAAYGGSEAVTVDQFTFLNSLIVIINILLTFLGLVFLLLLIYGGYLWMTARGNEDQVTKAKELIKQIIIGLFIIVFARLATELILSIVSKSIAIQ